MSGRAGQEGRRANRLARETSPYLLQHAHNPVDWWPWSPEAFAEARQRDVPIFLSIGYSTCYWCHVMERESFEDEATAALMNERFVSIKVDREERPDVDDIYMAATQILTGHGGWPMSVFLDPATLRPFWAGTYYPPVPRHGLPSFKQLLGGMSDAYRDRRDEVLRQAEELGGAVAEHLAGARTRADLGMAQVTGAISALLRMFDRVEGGFGRAPKFPQPVYLDLLLTSRAHAGDDATRGAIDQAVKHTLERMAVGGIFDQVGGGFHRYSVDAHWTVPHFEKMLYDNALLLGPYAEASAIYGDGFFARVVTRTVDYLLREMLLPQGAFASAQDAEVEHREGGNYVWTPEQVRQVLSGDDAAFTIRAYGLDAGPNFKDPHHPSEPAVNVLRLSERPERVAATMGMEPEAFDAAIERVNAALLAARAKRPQPHLDDKIIAGWNGLLIAGLARASGVDARAAQAATRAARFVMERMIDAEGNLLRVARGDVVRQPAPLEDYAFMAHGLATLALHVERERAWATDAATRLAARAKALFWDREEGGFFDTTADAPDLFVRSRSSYDGAIPSGTSVMINALIDLHGLTGERGHLDDAAATLGSISSAVADMPVSTANSTRGLLRLLVAGAIEDKGEREPAPVRRDGGIETPVEIYASEERVAVGEDTPAEVMLRFRVAPGHHLISPLSPAILSGRERLVPLGVRVINGSGVRAFADYPEGTPMEEMEGVNALSGEFEMRIAIDREGEWKGTPLLAVTFQACTGTECLAARTVELDVAIDRA